MPILSKISITIFINNSNKLVIETVTSRNIENYVVLIPPKKAVPWRIFSPRNSFDNPFLKEKGSCQVRYVSIFARHSSMILSISSICASSGLYFFKIFRLRAFQSNDLI